MVAQAILRRPALAPYSKPNWCNRCMGYRPRAHVCDDWPDAGPREFACPGEFTADGTLKPHCRQCAA